MVLMPDLWLLKLKYCKEPLKAGAAYSMATAALIFSFVGPANLLGIAGSFVTRLG